jgi:uncharacterized protein with beta-barrel porin domain
MQHRSILRSALLAMAAFAGATSTRDVDARPVRGTTRTSVNRDVNVNRNVNRNVNVHRDIDVDVDHGHYHPVARAVGVTAATAATAAVVGSVVHSLPPSCTTVVTAGVAYQQCGGTYYQPRYVGTQISYVVVNPP